VLTSSGIDTDDPKAAKIPLAGTAVAILGS